MTPVTVSLHNKLVRCGRPNIWSGHAVFDVDDLAVIVRWVSFHPLGCIDRWVSIAYWLEGCGLQIVLVVYSV